MPEYLRKITNIVMKVHDDAAITSTFYQNHE